MIPRETIERILETARIEEVIGDFVTLKKAGSNYKALSPFSNEKTPSFMVSPAKQIFKDFSSGKGGNVISFVMEHEQYSYPEALRYLADKYNIEIEEEEQTPESINRMNERESLFIVSEFAQNYFKEQMHDTEQGRAIALSYFVERGFSEEIIENFGLGYCPDTYDGFTSHALEQGYQLEYLEKAGLTKVRDGKRFDFFRGRVTFPIHNLTGKVIGFGARTLKSELKGPKYLNSPETDIYSKSKVLYGLFQAKREIVKLDNCYLVEGYTDVLSMHQAGVENVVASSGTALTPDQVRLVKRYSNNITILYDGDPAGIKASFRGIDIILEAGMNVKVVLFPEGEDPDSFAKKNTTEEFQQYIADNSKDFLVFKSDVLLADVKDDPVKKSALIHEIVNSIALIPDQITRSIYIKECSSRFGLTEQALVNELNKARRAFNKKRQGREDTVIDTGVPLEKVEQKKSPEDDIEPQEHDVIRLLLNYGTEDLELEAIQDDEDITIRIPVAQFVVHEFVNDGINFDNALYQLVLEEYASFLENDEVPEAAYFINHENSYVSRLAVDVLSDPHQLSTNWEEKHNIYTTPEENKLLNSILKSVYALKLKKVGQMIMEIQSHLKNMEDVEITEENDPITPMMEQQKLLIDAKRLISDQLGRIVVR